MSAISRSGTFPAVNGSTSFAVARLYRARAVGRVDGDIHRTPIGATLRAPRFPGCAPRTEEVFDAILRQSRAAQHRLQYPIDD